MNKTSFKKLDATFKKWYLIDAKGKILGRLSTTISSILTGKTAINYSPHLDNGCNIIIINAHEIATSGNKENQKLYKRHSGTPGGMKIESLAQLRSRMPARIIRTAVKGMLPKGRLGRRLLNNLKIYTGPGHPHAAQQPQILQ